MPTRQMSKPSRKKALVGAGVLGATAASAWLTARRTGQASDARRAGTDSGRPVAVRGSDGGYRHVRVHGPDDAPTLVLVHCWTGTQELWHKQVEALAGELRIVTYDHRGHGLSEDARDGDYSLATLAKDLDLVMEATVPDGERPLVVGHSLGAMTIAAWADAHDGEVASLIRGAALLSTGLEELSTHTMVIRPLSGPFSTVRGRLADAVIEAPGPLTGLPVPILKLGVAYAALAPGAADEDVELTTRMALDCSTKARAKCGQAMSRMSLLTKLDSLDVPTIVVAGERDLMTPIVHAERIELALSHSLGLRVDPDAGHMTPLESPEVVNNALRELVMMADRAEAAIPAAG